MLAYIHILSGAVDPGYGQGQPGGHPSHGLPGSPAYPSHGLPGQGGTPGHDLPQPPVSHLPPQIGQLPIYPATPSHPITIPPGAVYPPLGPEVPQGKALAVVYISGVGARWTVIDTSLSVGGGPATPPNVPSQGLPPTAQPRY